MNWETFFLVCFGVGLVSTLVSFFAGALHLHLPTKFHMGHVGHGHAPGTGVNVSHISAFNLPTIMAFLAWFGGMGYMMTHNFGLGLTVSMLVSVLAGLFGGAVVYRILLHVSATDAAIDPADDDMIGVVGTVDSVIRNGGTGEVVYLRRGTRHTCNARTEDGSVIEKGAEVVVTKFEHGVAWVRRWEEFAESTTAAKA
jgi:membrane protein implicated in regulation of membrane protease activity